MYFVDLVNEDDDVVMTDKNKDIKTLKKKFNFQKKLITQVRKHPALYDNNHKLFSNVAKKEQIWQRISKILKTDVDVCKNTWIELRYGYQRHARRLHNFFLHGHKQNRKRPAMGLELELMFLWKFIESRKKSTLPFDISDIITEPEVEAVNNDKKEVTNKEIDDDLILVEQPVELIVIDEDDEHGRSYKQFKVTNDMKKLVEEIKTFPELYDCDHPAFKDYTGKSLIWNGISFKLGDKATKLMKCWVIMQTRYEWELMNKTENAENKPSELQIELDFLKDYILKNPDTVYKQSYYLKICWHDPIDYFKDIYNLIVRMKKIADIVNVTESLLYSKEKSKEYINLWSEFAIVKGPTAGQCETTWLIMRYFYWELMNMRKFKYNLADKWYFESIITELYAIAKATQEAKQNYEAKVLKQFKAGKKAKANSSISVSDVSTYSVTTISSEQNMSNVNRNQQSLPVATTNFATNNVNRNQQTLPIATTSITSPSVTATPTITMPKITAAISLAPQALKNNKFLVKQIGGASGVNNIQQSVAPHTQTAINGVVPSAAAAVPTTSVQQQIQPPPMRMPFNLPNQLQMTSVPMSPNSMPPALKPSVATVQQVIGGTPPAYITIRPKPIVRPSSSKLNAMPTLTPATVNLNIRPVMPTIVQPPTTPSSNSFVITPKPADSTPAAATPTPTQLISSLNITTPSSLSPVATNQGTPAVSNNPIATTTSITSVTSKTTTSTNQLPKISGAVSLLNPNEILIELIASQSGKHLVVHGPPLSTKYQLPMPTVAKFIREIMGIPMLHNKRVNQPAIINNCWDQIAQHFNLPVHICRACWNFLLQNFNHFPQIAPLKELMRPFPTTFNVWVESTTLFKEFDEHCTSRGWLEYMGRLPEVIECIGCYPILYQDIGKEGNEATESQIEMESFCAWRTINLRFPKITALKEIWKSFKNCFCQYMSDLEYSIENKWPLNWWRALARLKFLVEAKYSTNEPFYYIVSNKMVEEIERCAMLEMKLKYNKNDSKPEEIPVEVIKPEVSEKPSFVISLDDKEVENDIELGALLTAIQKQPEAFNKTDTVAKYEAWKNVAKELHMSVTDCLIIFRRAVQNYFQFKKQDTRNNCRINEQYYKRLETIIRHIQSSKASTTSHSKLNIKTPSEINENLDFLSLCQNYVYPERFISDINMTSCPSNLVVKNWIYGFGNVDTKTNNNTIKTKLSSILNKYVKNYTNK